MLEVASATASVGIVFALACLTRYEAWPVTAVALAAAVWTRWRAGHSWRAAVRRVLPIACYPVAAVAGVRRLQPGRRRRVVRDERILRAREPRAWRSLDRRVQVVWGVRVAQRLRLDGGRDRRPGRPRSSPAAARSRARSSAGAARPGWHAPPFPWLAFVDGHPYRIRYMVPLVVAQAVGVGAAGGTREAAAPGDRSARSLLLVASSCAPSIASAPMVVEAQWDRPNVAARQQVTDCLRAAYSGDTIMASMGSLGHYMQELSRAGFALRDFLHEGNGDIWLAALDGPRPYVGWILIEEEAEGGDMLAHTARENPRFLDGFSRVCEGAGVALYRRTDRHGPKPRRALRVVLRVLRDFVV